MPTRPCLAWALKAGSIPASRSSILIAMFGLKAHRQIIAGLDAQIAETRKALDEAAAIRKEAEALLADAKHKQAAKRGRCRRARRSRQGRSRAIVAKAEADTAALVARREKMAHDKIGAAERAAVDALRARAASAATAAAGALIADTTTPRPTRAWSTRRSPRSDFGPLRGEGRGVSSKDWLDLAQFPLILSLSKDHRAHATVP